MLVSDRPPASEVFTSDAWLLFATRSVRLFAYGAVSIMLALYLAEIGLTDSEIGLLLTLTLVGDTLSSLWLTTHADRLGRRLILIVGAALMVLAGIVFTVPHSFSVLLIAATIGVISPSGNEVGPFLPVEQAALSQVVAGHRRTGVFAWYSLSGSLALGALTGGLAIGGLQPRLDSLAAYRVSLPAMPSQESPSRRSSPCSPRPWKSQPTRHHHCITHGDSTAQVRAYALFGMDAFAGGFVIQSLMAYWFGANLLAALSAFSAVWRAARFGVVNAMVCTHLPSNVLLILVPLMPNAIQHLADVPTRQSCTMADVNAEERSAAAGITGAARTAGAALSPALAGLKLGSVWWMIVGSAIVRRVAEAGSKPREQVLSDIGQYAAELIAAIEAG